MTRFTQDAGHLGVQDRGWDLAQQKRPEVIAMRMRFRRSLSPEHREAVSLAWQSRHVPLVSLLMVTLLGTAVLSAVLQTLAQGR